MCWRSATTGGQRQSDWGDMVPRRALQKLGGNVLVSPEEPACLASVGEFPLSRELRERSLGAPNIQHTAESLALAARAGWVRGDAAALTRAGRRLFRLAGAGGPLLEGGGTIAGEADATQALAREVLALGDLAARPAAGRDDPAVGRRPGTVAGAVPGPGAARRRLRHLSLVRRSAGAPAVQRPGASGCGRPFPQGRRRHGRPRPPGPRGRPAGGAG